MNEGLDQYRRCCESVIDQLDRYEGEEIVAGEHPLHLAICGLEEMTRVMAPERRGMRHRLVYSSQWLWFSLIRASRGSNALAHGFLEEREYWDSRLPTDLQERAKMLAEMLILSIRSMSQLVDLIQKTDGNLPFVRQDYRVKPAGNNDDG